MMNPQQNDHWHDPSEWKGFHCQRCGECCRQRGYVYVTQEEAENAARELQMSAFDFINTHCELLDRRNLVLKKHPDESCLFLENNRCLIQNAKPSQCADFPAMWNTPRSYHYCSGIRNMKRFKP